MAFQRLFVQRVAQSVHIPDDLHRRGLSYRHVRVPNRLESAQQSAIGSTIFRQYMTLQHSHLDHYQFEDLFRH